VVGAQAGLVDGEGALKQGAGRGEVALGGQDFGEVAEAVGGGGMVVAEAGLADRQRALVEAAGGGQVALVVEDRSEVAKAVGGEVMVGA
jgi:hypothetical protein